MEGNLDLKDITIINNPRGYLYVSKYACVCISMNTYGYRGYGCNHVDMFIYV